MRTISYREALAEGLVQAMELDSDVFIMGIGVDYPSGIFGTTCEAAKRFAPHRVFDTPACENALTGIALGAAAMGKRPVLVHARNDFMFLGFDQMINLAAKWRYMFGGTTGVPIVVRGIIGKGWGQGATHSQSLQSVLGHFPGLCVVMPALPCDAKGLILSALRHSSPVVILEHRALYDTVGEVPYDPVPVAIGKASVVREGTDLTIVATSYMVVEALLAAEALAGQGHSVEVIDPRSIRPLDEETILASVRKTGRLVVADTTWKLYGFASEVAALAVEKAYHDLKAPVARVTVADCPAPVSRTLEQAFYPDANTVVTAALRVLNESSAAGLIHREDKFMGPY